MAQRSTTRRYYPSRKGNHGEALKKEKIGTEGLREISAIGKRKRRMVGSFELASNSDIVSFPTVSQHLLYPIICVTLMWHQIFTSSGSTSRYQLQHRFDSLATIDIFPRRTMLVFHTVRNVNGHPRRLEFYYLTYKWRAWSTERETMNYKIIDALDHLGYLLYLGHALLPFANQKCSVAWFW